MKRLADLQGLLSLSSEEALEVINTLPFAYYRADLDGNIVAVSQRMASIFGFTTLDRAIGINIGDYYAHPAGRARFLEALAQGNGKVDDFEAEMVGENGAFWISTSAQVIYDDDGKPTGVEGLARDITEQRKIFQKLGHGAALFEAFSRSADFGVLITTPAGREVFANPMARMLLGVHERESDDSSIYNMLSDEIRALARQHYQELLDGNSVAHRDLPLTINGETEWRSYSLFLLETDDSDEPYFCLSIRDITQKKIEEARLIQTTKLASLGELAAGIAHEINQPLNTIALALANLANHLKRSDVTDAKTTGSLEKIKTQVNRAGEIVRQLLLFGREADDTHQQCSPIAAINNIAQMVEQTLNVDNIALDIELPSPEKHSGSGNADKEVTCNLIKLEQVLMNLIGNAKDAINQYRRDTDSPRYQGKLLISLSYTPTHTEIRVQDNGAGIDESIKEKIMEPFVTSKPIGSGTGLGLSVSHGIVTSAGGSLELVNCDQGVRANIVLPLAQ
jgi:PAS domain S-box-containing protein